MNFLRDIALSGAFLTLMTTAGYAEADAAAGRTVAEEWCTRCHDIEAGGAFKQHPPSFASVAIYRSAEQIHARIAYPPLHVNMPKLGYILTPQNVQDLVAYIVSLDTQ